MGKLSTARRVFKTQGVAGLMTSFKQRYLDTLVGRQINWFGGKAIELRGNCIEIEGCRFSLDSPAITTQSKSKFLFGQYERPEREAVARYLDPSLPVVEFGGSIGVVSCLTNKRLIHPECHVVVEANPTLIPLLELNRDRNQCRFTILSRMVAYGAGRHAFYANTENFVIGSAIRGELSNAIEISDVETITLRTILEQYEFDRCTLICDIEGGESDLLRYESEVLRDRVETLILEVHEWSLGHNRVNELLAELSDLGFRNVSAEADTYTFQKQPNKQFDKRELVS